MGSDVVHFFLDSIRPMPLSGALGFAAAAARGISMRKASTRF